MSEYIVPGCGIVNDIKTSSQIIIPEFGIYNEQESSTPLGNPYWYYNMLRRR